MRATVRTRPGNAQFHLRARIQLAPHGELAAYELRALPHAAQAEVPFPALRAQHLRVDPLAVVAHPHSKLPLVVADLHFDLLRSRVAEGVAQRLAGDAEDLVAHDRMQSARRALHFDMQRCSIAVLVRELFAERPQRVGEVVRLGGRGPQSLHRVAALRDRLGRLVDGALKDLLRFGRTIRQKVERGLEPQQQPVEALQQRVVQVACDARPLADTRLQRHLELTIQPPDA